MSRTPAIRLLCLLLACLTCHVTVHATCGPADWLPRGDGDGDGWSCVALAPCYDLHWRVVGEAIEVGIEVAPSTPGEDPPPTWRDACRGLLTGSCGCSAERAAAWRGDEARGPRGGANVMRAAAPCGECSAVRAMRPAASMPPCL